MRETTRLGRLAMRINAVADWLRYWWLDLVIALAALACGAWILWGVWR